MAVGAVLFQRGLPQVNTNGTTAGLTAAQAALQGIGLSVVAAGVTGLVLFGWVLISDTLRNRVQVLDNFGIHDYFDTNTTPIRGEYASRLTKSSRSIDVLGLGLNKLRQDFGQQFAGWAENGKVRIILTDPLFPTAELSYADQRGSEERDPAGAVRSQVESWISDTARLRQSKPNNFEVRLATCLPTITLVKVDGELFWSPYLMRRSSGATPTMLVRKGGLLYDVLTDHFDEIWNDPELSHSVPDPDPVAAPMGPAAPQV
jgi:hypothetical protein